MICLMRMRMENILQLLCNLLISDPVTALDIIHTARSAHRKIAQLFNQNTACSQRGSCKFDETNAAHRNQLHAGIKSRTRIARISSQIAKSAAVCDIIKIKCDHRVD